MRIAEIIPISEGKHIKLTLEKDALSVTGIFFGAEFASFPFFAGDRVDILYNLDVNTFRDTKTLQLVLRDVRRSKLMTEAADKKSEQYAVLKEGVKIPDGADLIPDRDDFRAAYVYLKKKHSDRSFYTTELSGQAPREGFFRTDVLCMSRYLSTVKRFPIGIVKLLIILDVFDETGIISREKTDDPLMQKIRLADISNQNKINLERSELLRRLKGLYR